MSNKKDRPSVYIIPPNYREAGSFFGGLLKIRNAIEAGFLSTIIIYIISETGLSLYGKIIAICLTALPIALFAIIGIGGESLFSFILNFLKFVKNRRIIGENKEDSQKKAGRSLIIKQTGTRFNRSFIRTINETAAYLPIKDIRNGIIYTKDNRYIKIVEIEPINFLLRNSEEQQSIIYAFVSFLKISPVKLQFKVISKRADTNSHLATLKKHNIVSANESFKKLRGAYEELVRHIGSREAVTRRFLLIFEYEPLYGSQPKNTEAEAISQLKTAVQTVQNYLRHCGNSLTKHENEDEFLSEIIFQLLNRGSLSEVNFENHILDVINKFTEVHGKVSKINDIPAAEFVAPKSIDFTHSGFVLIDGVYHAYLMIPSEGYKSQVMAGWTSLMVNAGEGIDFDLFFSKEPKDRIQQKLGQQIRINRSRIKDVSDTNTDFDDLESAIHSGYFLKRGISNNEDFYYLNILITVIAFSEKELEWRVNEMKKLMISQDLEVYRCSFRQEQAFLSSLPLLKMDKFLFERSKRNALSLGAASCYPFTSFELSDDNGILLGINKHNYSLVIIDLFNSQLYKNANLVMMGTSGSGKTYCLQLIALRMRMRDIPVFIIAPLKGFEFHRACKNIDGAFIQISPASKNCINVMEIRKTDTIAHELIDEAVTGQSKLATKIQSLHIFFSLLIPDMSHEEKQLLDDAMIRTYEQKGITHENESLVSSDGITYKEMPILGDLHMILLQTPETKRLANILNRLVNGSARSFNQQTNVDLTNKYTVLDISELTGDLLVVGMFVAIDFVWDKAKEDRTIEKTIIIDEIWKLIGASSNPLAANYCLEIFKIIRGYGGSAICASQDLIDFFALDDGKYGNGIINAAKTKIVLNLEPEEMKRVKNALQLSDTEAMAVQHFERGNGLISTNNNNVMIEIKASRIENELITTDRRELKEILDKKRNSQNM